MLDTVFNIPVEYDRHFEVIRAATPKLVREAYRLRYQVYCVENPYEDPEQQIGACESDADDDRSIHTLLLHRRTGEIAGTTRVILPDPQRVRPLPMASLLYGADRRRFDSFPVEQTVELSRFAVSKEFRKRRGEERYADAGFGDSTSVETERRLMPFVSLGLIRGMFGICLEHGISHIAAVMEPALIRILHKLGLEFAPVGGVVVHHGLRQPCIALLDDLIEHSRENETLVWQYAMEPLLRERNDPRQQAAVEPAYQMAV